MNLIEFVERLRNKPQIHHFDEATTKQTIILPMLQILGWEIFDSDEVSPEFYVENRRVDYCLKVNNQNEFFIEVKRTVEDLENHQEQLLEYAFRQGVELASLTNGITWHFYLPMKKGDWTARRFYTIDILEQEPSEVVGQFQKILSKEQIRNGDSIRYAEEIYKGRLKKDAILHALPKAWNKIISEPDELLVELLSEVTEKICGFKPRENIILDFIKKNNKSCLINEPLTTVGVINKKQSITVSRKQIPEKKGPQQQTKKHSPKGFPPDGTMCRFTYKGNEYNGQIKKREFIVNGYGTFSSFSAASVGISNTSRNGWRDWEIKIPGSNQWVLADIWRKREI